MAEEALVLTLIGPDGSRQGPPQEVVAAVDEPHTLLSTIREMVGAVADGHPMSAYATEVALVDGAVHYHLRFLDDEERS